MGRLRVWGCPISGAGDVLGPKEAEEEEEDGRRKKNRKNERNCSRRQVG